MLFTGTRSNLHLTIAQNLSNPNPEMANTNIIINHIAMFPWFSFGHLIPFLHLANKLAERGHKVSFLLPKGAQTKLNKLNQYPDLIQFFSLVVPCVDGIPHGAETTSDVPFQLHNKLCVAFDQTQKQVETILATIKPDFVVYDFAFWVPAMGHELGLNFKSIRFVVVCAASIALLVVPAKKIEKTMTVEELMQPPPGYPSSKVLPRLDEAAKAISALGTDFAGLSLYERLTTSMKESDAIVFRTCRETEGQFCNYVAQQYAKPVMLTGPLLPEIPTSQLEDKWDNWLRNFEVGSVVYCSFGSQIVLKKDQFQELLFGFELCGLPFLVALSPPEGCSMIEEALPDGFQQRIQGRGCVYGGWVPHVQILKHPSVGCFVSHGGPGSIWESWLSDCQIVLIPYLTDQIISTMHLAEELQVAVEVKSEENGWVSKENLSKAINLVMDQNSEVATVLKSNHSKWKKILSSKDYQENYIDNFINNMQGLLH